MHGLESTIYATAATATTAAGATTTTTSMRGEQFNSSSYDLMDGLAVFAALPIALLGYRYRYATVAAMKSRQLVCVLLHRRSCKKKTISSAVTKH